MAENSKIEWCDHTFNRKRPANYAFRVAATREKLAH